MYETPVISKYCRKISAGVGPKNTNRSKVPASAMKYAIWSGKMSTNCWAALCKKTPAVTSGLSQKFVRMPFGFENTPETLIRKRNKKEAKCFTHDRK
jgi:hypothetical protein